MRFRVLFMLYCFYFLYVQKKKELIIKCYLYLHYYFSANTHNWHQLTRTHKLIILFLYFDNILVQC